MEDFTGGLTERFDLQKAPANLLQIMLKGVAKGSLMGCALDVSLSQDSALSVRLSVNLLCHLINSFTVIYK